MPVAIASDIEALLQLSFDNDPEPKADLVIVAAQRAVEAEVGMPFDADLGLIATFTGRGQERLTLPQWPVSGVTSLTIDGVAATETVDFYLDPAGYLERSLSSFVTTMADASSLWWSAPRGIVVTYDAGWADETVAPAVLRNLVAEIAARVWQAGISLAEADVPAGVIQETLGMSSLTYGEFAQDGSWAIQLNEQEIRRARKLRRSSLGALQT